MNIYKLTPIQSKTSNTRWKTSDYQGEVIVRAESEEKARSLISDSIYTGTYRISSNQSTSDSLSPWKKYENEEDLILCSPYQDQEFSINGEERILYPYKLNRRIPMKKFDKDIKIFIIRPVDKQYKEKISYADDESDARTSAQAEYSPAKPTWLVSQREKEDGYIEDDHVYTDKRLSTCELASPEIIDIYSSVFPSANLDMVKIKYNGKIYDLIKYGVDDL
ncbi:MAG TPA: hypothetical protein VNC84_05095 [Gammaproteobacteria bacterium]|jgi:hypothetical protein|nr:hypothetical protein [Gammaproteobacteria bacterium]